MIIPVYKPLGASSHQLAAEIGLARGEKATHTGTLDPLAEGVLVVLTGEDRFKKVELSNTQKTYVFEIVFGLTTDSFDLLGIPSETESKLQSLEKIEQSLTEVIPQLVGEIQQQQPHFSAGRHSGKSFFERAKEKLPIPTKINTISIHSLELIQTEWITTKKMVAIHVERINLVKGDFRQKAILAAWSKLTEQLPEKLPLVKLQTTVSKRTYVRALVRDLAAQIGVPAATFSIIRTQNGTYTIADCMTPKRLH